MLQKGKKLKYIYINSIIIPLIFLFVLFSGISTIIGRLVLISTLLLLLLYFYKFLTNGIKSIHWSVLHTFILLYCLTVLFSMYFTIDYISLKKFTYELLRALVIFFILTEVLIYYIDKNSIRIIKLFFIVLIVSAMVGSIATIFFFFKNPIIIQSAELLGSNIRGKGWAKDPNYFSILLITIIAITYPLLKHEKNKYYKLFYLLSIMVNISGIALTLSRGGYLGLAFLLLIILFKERKNKKVFITTAVILFILFLIFGSKIISRLTSLGSVSISYDRSLYYHLKLGEVAILDILKSPLFGIGFGDFHESATHCITNTFSSHFYSEDIWLQIASESGIISLIMYLGIVLTSFSLIHKTKKMIKYKKLLFENNILESMQYAQISFFFPALFTPIHLYFLLWVYWAFTIAIVYGIYKGASTYASRS